MRLNKIFCLISSGLVLFSCVKHEVIPAPEHTVDLTYSFSGVVDNDTISLSADNLDYTCLPTQEKNLVSPPLLSSAIYYSRISSTLSTQSIQIGLGEIQWDRTSGDDPVLSTFNTFFTGVSNAFPSYNDNCSSGFKVIYTDELGSVYTSRADSSTYKDVKFSNIRQDSDATGDYSKFTSTFNCYVYYESGTLPLQGKDSLKIQMGRLKGYFKR
jgi:hypothetical protein